VLDALSERLQNAIGSVWDDKTLTEEGIETALRDVRRALLEADVNLKTLRAFLSAVQDRAIGENVIKSVDPNQQFIKIVHDELVNLLGSEAKPLNLQSTPPTLIMLFGLQGSGKTTTAGKLAHLLKQQDKQIHLIAADVYRPAAVEQLVQLANAQGVAVYADPGNTDVLAIVKAGIAEATLAKADIIIVDTAGRLQIDTDMMAELLLLERTFTPHEKLLVVDAMTGQEAVKVALNFDTQIGITGLVLTKLDGDSRGGAALSVVHMTQKPIKFIGVSEKPDGLEVFHPDRLAGRMLGMGDVVSLVEKAQLAVDEASAQKMQEKFRQNRFGFDDYLKLQQQLKKLGPMENLLAMLPIPGLDKTMRQQMASGGESQQKVLAAMVGSMTPNERQNPELISGKRLQRIAQGCGQPLEGVEAQVTQFMGMRSAMQMMTQMMDALKSGDLSALFGGLGGDASTDASAADDDDDDDSPFDFASLFGGMTGDDSAKKAQKAPPKRPPWLMG
jgi:signal recognition particle subunit SRP54